MALRANPEEEMLKLRERYQKSRAQQKGIKPEVKETLKKETSNSEVVVEKKRIIKKVKKQNPYIRLIKHDIESLFKLFKRIMGLKIRTAKETEKPLDLSWLEKNSGKLF